jgi:tetrahydromethanopterin S-methyltransferase subunit G
MNENELISRLDRIDEQLTSLNRDVVAAIASGKSAHHRIDDLKKDICWTLGTSVTVVGIFASVLTSFLQHV